MAGVGAAGLCVFVSGGGSNLQALIDAGFNIVQVVANRPCAALDRAAAAGIATVITPNPGVETIAPGVSLIVLAGYLRQIPPQLTAAWEGRMINIHPALLPDFGGPGMYGHHVHAAVLAAGRAESGCSVHFVTDEIDGGAVIAQRRVPVLPGDSPATLAARVLEQEHLLIVQAVDQLLQDPKFDTPLTPH